MNEVIETIEDDTLDKELVESFNCKMYKSNEVNESDSKIERAVIKNKDVEIR